MWEAYEKQLKWLEVVTAYDAYKQACGHADVAEQLRRKARDRVYGMCLAGTATMEDITQLPVMQGRSLGADVCLGIHLDRLLMEYNQLP